MNIQVIWNETDITNETIEYERTGKICSGVSNCTLTLGYTGRNFNPYNTIVIYEGGIKKGTYFITSITRDVNAHTVILETQDSTKQLNDYFIPDTYDIEEPTYAKYWIEKFLTEAGVSYQFDVSGSGSVLNNQDVLGMQSALEVLTKLVQISGWYFYADADNVIHINTLSKNPSNYKFYLRSSEVLELGFHKDDKMLRNRSVVWGASNPVTQQWAFADVRVRTGYETSASDWRSTLVVNTHIENRASAVAIANKFLKEMKNATEVKTVVCAGYYNFILGDTIFVQTRKFNGNGLVTSYVVNATTNGFTTTFILDERCPRMFGYYTFDGYVYASTMGAGVWRKPLNYVHVWEDFSDGLTNLNIIDLSINNGIFSCVSTSGTLYTRTNIDSVWSPFTPSGFYHYVTGEPVSGVICTSCSVDKFNNHIYATYAAMGETQLTIPYPTLSGELEGSWLVDIASLYPKTYTTLPIVLDNVYPSGYVPPSGYAIPSGEFRVGALDVDNNGVTQIASAMVGGNTLLELIDPESGSLGSANEELISYSEKFSVNKNYGDQYYTILPQADENKEVIISFPFLLNASGLPLGYPDTDTTMVSVSTQGYSSNNRIVSPYDIPVYSGMAYFTKFSSDTYINYTPYFSLDQAHPENSNFTTVITKSISIPGVAYMDYFRDSWQDGDFYYALWLERIADNYVNLYLGKIDLINNTSSLDLVRTLPGKILLSDLNKEMIFSPNSSIFKINPTHFKVLSGYVYLAFDYVQQASPLIKKTVFCIINLSTFDLITESYITDHYMDSVVRYSKFTQLVDDGTNVYSYTTTFHGDSIFVCKITLNPDGIEKEEVKVASHYWNTGISGGIQLIETGRNKTTSSFSAVFAGSGSWSWRYPPSPPDRYDIHFSMDQNLNITGLWDEIPSDNLLMSPLYVRLQHWVLRSNFISNRSLDVIAPADVPNNINDYRLYVINGYTGEAITEIKWQTLEGVRQPIIGASCSIDDIDNCIYVQFANLPLMGFDADSGELIKSFYYYNYENGNFVKYPYIRKLMDVVGNGVYYDSADYRKGCSVDFVIASHPITTKLWAGTAYRVIKRAEDKFHMNHIAFPSPPEVESSLTFPISVFGGHVASGIGTGNSTGYIYVSPFGNDNSYSVIYPEDWQNTVISDVREVDIDDGTDNELKTYVVFTQKHNDGTSAVSFFDATELPEANNIYYAGSGILASGILDRYAFSGYANHLEFTNFATFEFVSISGTTPIFYQKERDAINVSERSFIDRSTGFPNAEITQIRCDDSL